VEKDEKARHEVELDLAKKLLEEGLEPSLTNQVLALSILYNKNESLVRQSRRETRTYYTDQVEEAAMLQMIYINRLMRKLSRLHGKSY